MATPQLSPGILVREIDLTVGRAENVSDNIGAIAGPFVQGPVEEVIDISTQQDLLRVFGKPRTEDNQFEYWMSASSYLSYGGVLKVVRADNDNLKNAAIGYTSGDISDGIKIKNFDDYEDSYSDLTTYHFAAKDPGSWANGLKVCVVDNKADQTLTVNTANPSSVGLNVGVAVTSRLSNVILPGVGTTTLFNGYLKGIVTGVDQNTDGNSKFDVRVLSRVSDAVTTEDVFLDTTVSLGLTETAYAAGVTTVFVESTAGIQPLESFFRLDGATGAGNTVVSVGSTFVELQTGIAATIAQGAAVDFFAKNTTGGVETRVSYSPSGDGAAFKTGDLNVLNTSGTSNVTTLAVTSAVDWYNQQTLGLSNSTIYWNSIAPKPTDNIYTTDRNGEGDAIHIAVVDDDGSVSGIKANILEKYISLSKASDSVSNVDSPRKNYYKDYLANFSEYIYSGGNSYTTDGALVSPKVVGFTTYNGTLSESVANVSIGGWGSAASGTIFGAIGAVTFSLTGGDNYATGGQGGYKANTADLISAYDLFANETEVDVDYLIMGPGGDTIYDSQAKAQKLIAIAGARKDCIATISPHRASVLDTTNSNTQTDNILEFFGPLSSSSYAVFDSGYKYTYDNFNNKFRYIPCNADVAGLMARTTVTDFPWTSPAGQRRGILNNAVKLAYNPSKTQRDSLYGARINPISNQSGTGILLFGDKTGLGYASAFDRINVRRLFLNVEQVLKGAAEDQLFEINNGDTRAAFVNIVEPYLRDVRANGGIFDYRVICDDTNNTPDIVDNNEFRAEIYLKPTRTINFITLSFIATRTGVSFEEVAGF